MGTQGTVPTGSAETFAVAPGRWHVDPQASKAGFSTRTMLGLMKVKGDLALVDGELRVDGDGTWSGSMRLDTGTIRTGIAKRDTHLRSADFFHAAEHPHVEYVLDGIGSDGASAPVITGYLSIRGKRVPVSGSLSVERSGPNRIRLLTTVVADHKAAGLGWAKPGMIRGRIPLRADLALVRAGE